MRRFLAIATLLLSQLHAVAPNQMGLESNDGVMAGNVKLGMGWSMENHTAYRTHLLQGTLEFFPVDRISVRGSTGLPLSTALNDMKFFPFMMGGLIHLFPRYWFDIHIGAEAGFVHIGSAQLPANWSTRVTPVVGMTLYFWGAFYLEGEAGYSVLQYAKDTAVDLSAPVFRVRMGLYL